MEAVMGMTNRSAPPQGGLGTMQAHRNNPKAQNYTLPTEAQYNERLARAQSAAMQPMAAQAYGNMPGRQAFGWTPAGQTPQSQPSSGPLFRGAQSVWADAIRQAVRQARNGNVDWTYFAENDMEKRRAAREAGALANSYSSNMTDKTRSGMF